MNQLAGMDATHESVTHLLHERDPRPWSFPSTLLSDALQQSYKHSQSQSPSHCLSLLLLRLSYTQVSTGPSGCSVFYTQTPALSSLGHLESLATGAGQQWPTDQILRTFHTLRDFTNNKNAKPKIFTVWASAVSANPSERSSCTARPTESRVAWGAAPQQQQFVSLSLCLPASKNIYGDLVAAPHLVNWQNVLYMLHS